MGSAVRTRAASDIVAIGERLIAVKEVLGHGKFGAWLEAEFDWQERTSQKMMGVAQFCKSAQCADLNLPPSALYLLASPSTPPEVREEVIAAAKSGESITHKDVRQRVEAAKSIDEQCADENDYLDSIGMGGGEPAAPKRINIKRADEDEDDVPATATLERQVEHVVTRKASASRGPATWEWSKAFQTILECLNVIDQSGGIQAVAAGWDQDERTDYTNGISEVIDRFTEFRTQLRRKSQ